MARHYNTSTPALRLPAGLHVEFRAARGTSLVPTAVLGIPWTVFQWRVVIWLSHRIQCAGRRQPLLCPQLAPPGMRLARLFVFIVFIVFATPPVDTVRLPPRLYSRTPSWLPSIACCRVPRHVSLLV